jgi:DhnA family fructose-bisphosphate aldolase class Ia
MNTSCAIGKRRRLSHLFREDGKILMVPLDDSLLAGPTLGLEHIKEKLAFIMGSPPDAIVGFKGLFLNHADVLRPIPLILNVTASTTRSQHTRKVQISTVEDAVRLDCAAVAVHVNITSKFEHEMLSILGSIARQCESLGVPLLAHMYVRSEGPSGDENHETLKQQNRRKYAEMIAHAGRVGVEAGADFIKVQYTGDAEGFRLVVEACKPIPVVVAGGIPVSAPAALTNAFNAMSAGAAGISFGRNVFSRTNPKPMLAALRLIVHERASAETALKQNPELMADSTEARTRKAK